MPAMTPLVYAGGLRAVLGGGVTGGRDLDSDTFKATLHTSTYVPSASHAFQSDLTNELSTAGGYTAGGLTLAAPTLTRTDASSWSGVAATSTAYVVGQVVRPSSANGYAYRCVVAGTSGGSAPTWPTVVGREVTDGTVVWANIGTQVLKFSFTDPTWSSFTAGPFRTLVIADTSPGSAATNPLVCALSFASDQTGGGGPFTVNLDSVSGLFTVGM